MFEQALALVERINWYAASITALAFVTGLVAVLHALTYKRDPRSALGWIAVSLLYPFIGPILYLLFGVNRIRTSALQEFGRAVSRETGVYPHAARSPSFPAWEAYRPLIQLGDAMTGQPLLAGNHVSILEGGTEVYTAMLYEIEQAKSEILLSTYIFKYDRIGRQFVQCLAAAKQRGVAVHVLIDGVGDLYSIRSAARALMKADIAVVRFLRLSLFPPKIHMNLRNHRKILVVDSEVAFAGGLNISDAHGSVTQESGELIRDHHFKFEGSIVSELKKLFISDWNMATKKPLPDLPRQTEFRGQSVCRLLPDGPNENLDTLLSVLIGAISIARETIDLVTPYFLPPRELITALAAAALRGVRVRLFIPEKNNFPFVGWATHNMLWEVLQPGVEVYAVPPPFLHSKLYLIDGCYALVGSANLDARSLRLNFELLVEIYDEEVGKSLAEEIDSHLEEAKSVTLEQVDSRPFPVRVRDAFFWLFTPYL